MLVVHDWLKEYIGDSIPSAEKLGALLMEHSFEVEGTEKVGKHDVIDVDILPNRASDCLCHRGIAREVATLLSSSLESDPLSGQVELSPTTDKLEIHIEDDKACRRFGLALVTGVEVKESPMWLQDRLEAVGQRAINNVVDITNYVMLSLGQPLHAYDGDKFPKVDDVWKFGIRFAKEGEKVITLSDEEYELDTTTQLIVEAATDTSVGIAGVKGGKTAEVDKNTTTIIFEAANFDPTITRKTAQKLKLQTDASKRFENEVSRDVVPYALKEAVRLLEEIAGGVCEGYVDEYPTQSKNKSVEVTLDRINALLGLTLDSDVVEDIFDRLGFSAEIADGGWRVIAPFERTDINIEEDVIEEIGRVHGYSNISSIVPESVSLTTLNARHYYSDKIRGVLTNSGFSEVITSSFRKKDKVRLRNALATDKQYLRSSLVKGITEVLEKNIPNIDLLGIDDVRVFEIGAVFYKKEDKGISEHVSVALGVRKKKTGYTPKDDEGAKDAVEKIEEALGIKIEPSFEKGIVEYNLTELLEKLPAPKQYEPHTVSEETQYKQFSTYPFISRDIALFAGEDSTADDVEKAINEASGELRVRTTLFDEFTKDGRTSYAFRLVFQSYEKTLTDDEITPIMEVINKAIEDKNWEIR